jgi:hypothetical protein
MMVRRKFVTGVLTGIIISLGEIKGCSIPLKLSW